MTLTQFRAKLFPYFYYKLRFNIYIQIKKNQFLNVKNIKTSIKKRRCDEFLISWWLYDNKLREISHVMNWVIDSSYFLHITVALPNRRLILPKKTGKKIKSLYQLHFIYSNSIYKMNHTHENHEKNVSINPNLFS